MLFSRATAPAPTPIFHLRSLQLDDANQLYQVIHANRVYMRQWLPWVDNTQSMLDSKSFIEDVHHKYVKGENVVKAIWCDGQLVGCIGINEINRSHQKASLGYWLAKSHQGRGIMTQAAKQMTSTAFNELKLNRLEIISAAKNFRSRAVAQRLKYTQEGILYDFFRLHGHYYDVIIYSMLKRDWRG